MTKSKTVVVPFATFASITDIALRHGQAENNARSCAIAALDMVSGFPDLKQVSEENVDSLKAGYSLAYKEIFKEKMYAVINGHFVEATQAHEKNDKVEKLILGFEYCINLSSHEMATMFKDQPEKKEAIAKVRSLHSKYINKRMERLVTLAKDILAERSGEKKTRAESIFEVTLKKFLDSKVKSVKVRQAAGDPTANPAKYLTAVDAFWKAYKA
jgi:hypothetical protein